MKKSQTTSVLQDLMTRLEQHDMEMTVLRKVLDTQLIQIAQLQAEVELLHGRESLDSPGPHQMHAQPSPDEERRQASSALPRFTDRQEVLFSAARGWMWQP
jgi:uncharacterized membrane protein YccC